MTSHVFRLSGLGVLGFVLCGMRGVAIAQTEDQVTVEGTAERDAAAVTETETGPSFLSGDWGGARSNLVEKGLTFDLQWTQSAQGVVSGGVDTGWEYGGSVDLLASLDLGRMDVMEGGYLRVLVEGRYGQSVIGQAGTVLPVNTDLYFPLTDELDEDVLAISELSYTQFLSSQFAVVLGKLQTLDGDPTEFANGRGRSQFMNFSLVAPNLTGLAIPYSTLGAGIVVLPSDKVTVTSLIMNTTDSSTTSGFSDIGDGASWLTEVQFQYRLGKLPGGQNVGFAYAFDNDFLNYSRSGLTGSGLVVQNEDSTWTTYWSVWQYLMTLDDPPDVIAAGDGRLDVRGLGVFARLGVVDDDTNLVHWGGSIGIGGRGLIPTRDEDSFGFGFAYTEFNNQGLLSALLLEDEANGFEAYYNAALAPGVELTGDIQFLEPVVQRVSHTIVAGVRLNLRF